MGTQELQAWGSGHGIVITGHKACRLGGGAVTHGAGAPGPDYRHRGWGL